MHRKLVGTVVAAALAVGAAGAASAATAHGKIDKIDASARTFELKEGKQSQSFSLASDAKVMDGAKAVSLSQLKSGQAVKVEYTDQGTQHVASRVETNRTASAAKHAKTAAKPAKAPSSAY